MAYSEIKTEQNNRPISKKRWLGLWLVSLAVVYAPFLIASVYTWLYVSCKHCKVTWLKDFWLLPGMTLMYFLGVTGLDLDWDLDGIPSLLISGILTFVIVCLVAWLSGKGRIIRWVVWIICGLLSSFVALMAYFLVGA